MTNCILACLKDNIWWIGIWIGVGVVVAIIAPLLSGVPITWLNIGALALWAALVLAAYIFTCYRQCSRR